MKILVLVAPGFEDVELITTLDVFSRNNIEYTLVSVNNKRRVKGKFSAEVTTDINLSKPTIQDNDLAKYDGLFIPGGPGVDIMMKSKEIFWILEFFWLKNKVVAAICAAPKIIKKSKLFKEFKYTSFPGTAKSKNNTGESVEIDNTLITGRDYKSTIEFAESIVRKLEAFRR